MGDSDREDLAALGSAPRLGPNQSVRSRLFDGVVRTARNDRAFAAAAGAAALIAVTVLLYVARDLTFHYDEWSFLDYRMSFNIDSWMRPHNEHWSAIPVLVYQILFRIAGIRSYLPYLAVLMALHVTAATALYRLVARLAGPASALAAMSVMLLFGPGYDDLLWAFQIGFVASTASGLWALWLMSTGPTRSRSILVAILLLVGVASSGIGLIYLSAAGVRAAIDRSRHRYLASVALALVVYLAWWAVYGRTNAELTDRFGLQNLALIPAFVMQGTAATFGAVAGLGPAFGSIIAVAAFGGLALRWLRGGDVPPLAVVGVWGVAVSFLLIGFVRAGIGLEEPGASRYLYPAAPFPLLIAAAMIGRPGTRNEQVRRLALPVVAAAIVATSIPGLLAGRDAFLAIARETSAVIGFVERYRGTPAVPDKRMLSPLPTVGRLHEIVTAAGIPEAPRQNPSAYELDRALFRVAGGSFSTQTGTAVGMRVQVRLVDQHATDITPSPDGCLVVQVAGSDSYVTVTVPDGGSMTVTGEPSTEGLVYLERYALVPEHSLPVNLSFGPVSVVVPLLRDGQDWLLRFASQQGRAELCVAAPRPDR
jgi:hypothetical protein